MYVEVTDDIEIKVEPAFVEEQSRPELSYYFFAYHVKIRNLGARTVQLLSRHWIITDGSGVTEEVKGPGVIGEQPKLAPGNEFEYTSFCPLTTPTGNMRGTYQMEDNLGNRFEARIPLFFLRTPLSLH